MAKHKVITISVPALKRLFFILLTLTLLGSTAFITKKYFDERQRNEQVQRDLETLSDPALAAKRLEERTVTAVKAIALVPDEAPTVVKVEDADATNLKGQIFFESIENGDIILTYASARRIIIYRPAENKIVTAVTIPVEQSLPIEDTLPADEPQEETTVNETEE